MDQSDGEAELRLRTALARRAEEYRRLENALEKAIAHVQKREYVAAIAFASSAQGMLRDMRDTAQAMSTLTVADWHNAAARERAAQGWTCATCGKVWSVPFTSCPWCLARR